MYKVIILKHNKYYNLLQPYKHHNLTNVCGVKVQLRLQYRCKANAMTMLCYIDACYADVHTMTPVRLKCT